MLARCPHCPQCPHRKCAGFGGTVRACRSGWRSNGRECQQLRRLPAPTAARLPWRVAVRWPAGSRARLRYRMACTRTGRSVPGFHQQDCYRRQCAGVAASAQSSGSAFVVVLGRVPLSVSCPGLSVSRRWCVKVRLVFLSVPNAEALRELQGTRDTTPVLCRGLLSGRRGTRHWHRWRLLLQVGLSG